MSLVIGDLYDIKMCRGGFISSNARFVEFYDTVDPNGIIYMFITITGTKIKLTRRIVENSLYIFKSNCNTVTDDDIYL
jgi:hypothetical protein